MLFIDMHHTPIYVSKSQYTEASTWYNIGLRVVDQDTGRGESQ